MSDTEIKILEKGLDYAPIQNKVNELELRQDFDEFSRKMHLKWFFRNEATEDFSETSYFRCRLGKLHKDMLVWNYFEVKLRENYLRYLKNV